MSHLILENPATGEQVTEWLFGTTLATSGVARNDLVSGKVWPTGESESYLFNRQSDVIQRIDPNGSVRQFTYDKLGKPLDDAATTVAAGVDATIQRVSIAYNNRGQRDTVITYDAAGGGAVINQVKFEYDAFGLQTADRQAHDGPVDGSTPSVSYTYTNGSGNVLRRTSVTAPSGKQVDYTYGSGGSLDDVLNRVASLKIHDDTPNLVEKRRGIGAVLDKPLGLPAGRRPQVGGLSQYTWAGFGRLVTLLYPVPNAELSYLTPGAFNGDAGDPMTGYDRFGRTVRMPWKNGGTVLADIAYGYDRASRRTWRQDLTSTESTTFDRAYGYDALGQVKTADRGTLNSNRSAIGGIPQEAESWQYDEQGNCPSASRNDLEPGYAPLRDSLSASAPCQWLAYDKTEDGTSVIDQSRRSNVSNQIVTIDGSNEGVAYDKNGNMIRIPTGDALTGAPRKLVWNAWDQLVEVCNDTDALIQRNAYDGFFRRTTRTFPATPSGETVIHQYYNDHWKPIEERKDAATTPLNVYYWGARDGHRDDLIRRDRDANGDGTLDETLWCMMDYFDPIAILNDPGDVVERYAYSAFGVPTILAPNYSARAASSFAWDSLFHGQFTDDKTGYQNYGYRFYVPNLGVWPSGDPIGESDNSNLYAAFGNTAVNMVDWLGLQQWDGPKEPPPRNQTIPIPRPPIYKPGGQPDGRKYPDFEPPTIPIPTLPVPPPSPPAVFVDCYVTIELEDTNSSCPSCDKSSVTGHAREPIYPRVNIRGKSSGGAEEAKAKASSNADLDAASKIPENCKIKSVGQPECSGSGRGMLA
ncbi:MAG: hypothetical protein JNK37_16015 [Verrucomicrobiales bacterium]|nr:hypothetical protein [Verrucomicrobiales bacterium]